MEYRRKKTGRKTGRCKGAASARARLRSTSTGNFNASHSSLAAVEADLYGADVVERRRAKRGELLWDNSREMAKEFPKPEQVAHACSVVLLCGTAGPARLCSGWFFKPGIVCVWLYVGGHSQRVCSVCAVEQ